MVRRETTIEDGLRVVLEWLEQRRREYGDNMRKTWYTIFRRIKIKKQTGNNDFLSFTGPQEPFQQMLPAYGQFLTQRRRQWQRYEYRDIPKMITMSFNQFADPFVDVGASDSDRGYYYPGL